LLAHGFLAVHGLWDMLERAAQGFALHGAATAMPLIAVISTPEEIKAVTILLSFM
jgi:hypothetical protein